MDTEELKDIVYKSCFSIAKGEQTPETAIKAICESIEAYASAETILRSELLHLQKRFKVVYDDLQYIGVYQCKKCSHYTLKGYTCYYCGTDRTIE